MVFRKKKPDDREITGLFVFSVHASTCRMPCILDLRPQTPSNTDIEMLSATPNKTG